MSVRGRPGRHSGGAATSPAGRPNAGETRSVLPGLLLFALACGPPFAVDDAALSVRAGAGRLELRNASPEPIFYFAVERNTAAVLDWLPCTDPEACPRVPPGGSRAVGGVFLPYEEITGWETGEEEAILYWWHLVELEPPPMAVHEPDSIRSVDVRLPG